MLYCICSTNFYQLKYLSPEPNKWLLKVDELIPVTFYSRLSAERKY